jgi:hypothetical protein
MGVAVWIGLAFIMAVALGTASRLSDAKSHRMHRRLRKQQWDEEAA